VAEAGQLREQVEQLRREVADLAARVKQNSKNSSRPPLSDGLGKPAPKSLRTSTGRKPSRPKGQPGATSYRLAYHCGSVSAAAISRRR
jgi:hypothetical protein